MKFGIQFSNEALIDLFEAQQYYYLISKELGKRFTDSFNDEMSRLEINPESFQKRYRNINIVFTKTFPYGIHYIIIENVVYIQRILHQKQFYK